MASRGVMPRVWINAARVLATVLPPRHWSGTGPFTGTIMELPDLSRRTARPDRDRPCLCWLQIGDHLDLKDSLFLLELADDMEPENIVWVRLGQLLDC